MKVVAPTITSADWDKEVVQMTTNVAQILILYAESVMIKSSSRLVPNVVNIRVGNLFSISTHIQLNSNNNVKT